MKNPVGPVLRMGDEVELIIAAIEEDNAGHRDRGHRPRRLRPGARGRTRSRSPRDAAPLPGRGLRDQVPRRDHVRVGFTGSGWTELTCPMAMAAT